MDGVRPSEIVALTFTQNAAREMRSRLGFEIGFCGTLHSFLIGLIQRHWKDLGYSTPKLAVIDEEQANELLERCIKSMNYRGSKKAVMESINAGKIEGRKPSLAELVALSFIIEMMRNGLMTYDMILTEGLRLLNTGITLPYSHLLVDEMQDASDIDKDIYHALPIRNRFYVGDDSQAIYGFRGGNMANILSMAKRPGVEIVKLETNYRSDTSICDAAQRLIEHNQNRVDKKTISNSTEPGHIVVTNCKTPDAEMFNTLRRIREFDGDHAVLLRYNPHVDEWVKFLEGQGVPIARKERTERPKDWKLARLAVGLLSDPENDFIAYWYLRTRWKGSALADTSRMKAAAEGLSINSKLGIVPKHEFAYSLDVRFLARMDISQESIALIQSAIETLEPNATGTDLLGAMAGEEHHLDQIGAGVFVGTIHSAKGKEFDNVHIPACEDEIIPGKSKDAEEERRLFYVAMTRARHRLFISHCSERKPMFGGWTPVPATPSRFIHESGI